MNKLFFYSIICLLVASCTKRDEVGAPEFEVSASAATYKLGDSIIFNFKGNPQNIVFWPGTPGRVYEFRNRTFTTGNKLLMRFNSFQQYGVLNNMTVLVSNNFNGTYDATNVQAATWTDISSRFTLSQGLDQVPSGTVDLTEFTADNKSATIAFRYIVPAMANPNPNRWVIRSFFMDMEDAEGAVIPQATVATAGWKPVSFENPASNWLVMSTQLLTQATPNNADDDWILSKTFNPNAISPDKGIPIKNITTNLIRYSPATDLYNKPGTYKVIFEATNSSYQNEPERVVKEVTITVTP
jgi:hypothetical protein